MNPALLGLIQGTVVAVVFVFGQRIVARYSKQANDKTVAVQDRANDIDENDKLIRNLASRLTSVEARADLLADRVRALEDERIRDKSLIRNLWAYVVTLRERLKALGQPLPEPPGALDFDSPLV